MKHEKVFVFFLLISFAFRSSYDDLTRILLINWISITIYGSFVKIARNQWNIFAERETEWESWIELLHFTCSSHSDIDFYYTYNVIICEKNSVKNCMCHKSWCAPGAASQSKYIGRFFPRNILFLPSENIDSCQTKTFPENPENTGD